MVGLAADGPRPARASLRPRARKRAIRRPVNLASGFTLLELLVTVALTSILLTAAVTGFRSLVSSTRVVGLENEFVAAMHFARSEAVRRRRAVGVSAVNPAIPANEWGAGLTVWLDADDDGAFDAAKDTVLRVGQAAAGGTARLDSVAGVSALRFMGSGFIASFVPDTPGGATSSFRVCDGKAGRLVTLRATGQVTSSVQACE